MYLVIILWLLNGEVEASSTEADLATSYKTCVRQASDALTATENKELIDEMWEKDWVPGILCVKLPEYNEDGTEVKDPTAVKL